MDPFHEGERLAQERAGQRRAALENGALIASTLLPAAARFLAGLRLAALATVEDGWLRASVLAGEPGFLAAAPALDAVVIDLARLASDPDGALRSGASGRIGLLAIDLGTRKRYRVNGRLEPAGADALRIVVHEAYPNCPQYVQRRRLVSVGPRAAVRPAVRGGRLGAEQAALVHRADTAFVASSHPARGLDASHRGGAPGFIEVVAPDRLRVPDYAGNGLFNTLGNFLVDPRAGLAVLDFAAGRVLEVSGRATVSWEPARAWELAIERFAEHDLPLELRWGPPEAWPSDPRG